MRVVESGYERALEPLSNKRWLVPFLYLEIAQTERSIKYEKLYRYLGSIPSR